MFQIVKFSTGAPAYFWKRARLAASVSRVSAKADTEQAARRQPAGRINLRMTHTSLHVFAMYCSDAEGRRKVAPRGPCLTREAPADLIRGPRMAAQPAPQQYRPGSSVGRAGD